MDVVVLKMYLSVQMVMVKGEKKLKRCLIDADPKGALCIINEIKYNCSENWQQEKVRKEGQVIQGQKEYFNLNLHSSKWTWIRSPLSAKKY